MPWPPQAPNLYPIKHVGYDGEETVKFAPPCNMPIDLFRFSSNVFLFRPRIGFRSHFHRIATPKKPKSELICRFPPTIINYYNSIVEFFINYFFGSSNSEWILKWIFGSRKDSKGSGNRQIISDFCFLGVGMRWKWLLNHNALTRLKDIWRKT